VGGIHALVPVKVLVDAKTRLAERFTEQERRLLVLSMLTDTLSSALAAEGIDRVSVLTADDDVAAIARSLGVGILDEPASAGSLNNALAWALETISETGPVLILQADLPALTTADLTAFTRAARDDAVFVADHHGTGTTALLLNSRPSRMRPQFGDGSAARHRAAGARLAVGDWPGLRHDVDTAADLDAAIELGVGPATSAALAGSASVGGRS
jgi:2-phospho-L-lactate guanylyltransferase